MHWLKFLIKKIIKLAITLIGISIISFLLFNLAPGSPAEVILKKRSEKTDASQIKRLEKRLGVDKPLPIKYKNWLKKILHGDLGNSYLTGDPVEDKIANRWPVTARLAGCTFVFIVFLSTLGGVLGAYFQGGMLDNVHRFWTLLNISVPDYLLGQILIATFSVNLGIIPFTTSTYSSLILPVLTLGLPISAMQGRVLRSRILQILSQDYIRFSIAKGLGRMRTLWKHVLKNALGPVLTLWGISLGHLLGGTVIVETVFAR